MAMRISCVRRIFYVSGPNWIVLSASGSFKGLRGGFPGLALAVSSCKPKAPETTELPKRAPYFNTAFQDESQFIVEDIVSDLAQQMFYGAHHLAPDQRYSQVVATERRRPAGRSADI